MNGLGYISPSVNQTLTPSATLGAPGDMYIITDTRQRPRKDLSETKAFQRFDIEPYDGSEMPLPNENGVVLFPVKDLYFDTANFQNRDAEFSETSVNRILDAVDDGDFNWAIFDPITIWRNPGNGKFYVLSGHSRSEAFRRLSADGASVDGRNFDRIPAKIFAGTFEQAKELALNSNTLSTKETDLERANYYRERREKFAANGLKNSEIKKRLLELARKNEGKNATKIIYLSHLNPRGSVVDAVAATSDGASVDKNRVAVMAEWVGHLRYDFPMLTDFHERELFDFLKNGHYGVDVRNFNDFAKRVQTAIEKHTEWGVFDADKSLNLEKNLGKSENEKRFDAELDRLKSEWADAENILNRKLAEFKARQKRDASITDQQILQAVQPYKDAAILAKGAYFAFRDKRGDFLRADDAQMSLFGLGKPTIKFEFEDNAALADFLHATKKAADFADFEDVTNTATSAKPNAPKSKIRNGRLMPADDSRYLPESPAPYSLPPTNTPPQLPPSPTSPKALPPYRNVFPARQKFDKVKALYPNYIAFVKDGDYYITYDDDAKKIAPFLKTNLLKDKNGDAFVGFVDTALPINVAILNVEGLTCAVVDENSNVEIMQPTEPEPVQTPEPEVTAESVTDEEIETSNVTPVEIDWKAFEDAFAKASNWSSFDPERSARSYVGGYKEYYDQYVKQVPPQYLNAFNWFVKRYVSDLISKRSRTASAAVTGPGGITAQKAASLNRANDRFMAASVEFPHALLKYINKIRLREKRKAFINSSMDERYAARIKELERDVNGLKYYKKIIQHISQGGEIPDDVRQSYWYFSKDSYGGEPKFRDNVVNALQHRLNLNKATFKDKLTREVTNGNVEIVDAIIESLKPLGLFTNRAEIWQFPSFARRRRQSVDAEQQRVENNAQSENSLYRVEYDTQEDRVKIYFNGMPSDKIRTYLKSNGFRWSPRNKAWQRQITENARRAVRQFESLIQDGTLGKPTIKLEFEDNADLMSLFDTDGISGLTVNDKPADIFNCPESQLQTRGYQPTYIRLNDYSHLIDTADGRKTLKGYGFESATLDELVNACRYYPQVAALAAHLKDPNGDALQTAFNDWHWLHTNIRYDFDTPGEEEIRTPARVWRDRFSGVDCDCLAVMTACLLINQGFHPCFEIVAFNNEPTFSHIYVNLDGAAIDRVLPVFLARPDNITKTQIMEIPVYSLSGIGGCRDTLSGVYSSTLAKIQSGTATGEDNNDFRKTQVLVTLRGIDDAAYSLAALLMPHVVTIADDGTYYFDSTAMANLATKLDDDLRQLMADDADPETISQWIATAAQQIDGAASVQSNGGKDTIVVIINPQGNMTRVIGQMVKASTPTLTATTADAIDTPAATASPSADSPLYATTPAPIATPPADPEPESGNTWLWIAGISAALGIGAALTSGSGKKKRR